MDYWWRHLPRVIHGLYKIQRSPSDDVIFPALKKCQEPSRPPPLADLNAGFVHVDWFVLPRL